MDDDRNRWAAAVVLADGESAFLRPITPDDAAALRAFHERQPAEAQYRRFFSAKPTLSDTELRHFTDVDFRDRVALVLEIHGEFAAWASYERWQSRPDADVAFMVDIAHHGKGIATLMLEHLAAIARSRGITRFTAETLADNRPMLAVFSRAGWPVRRHFDSGVVDIDLPLADTDSFTESVDQREHRADSRAVARLLLPRSIAVIGASPRPGSVGNELWVSARRSSVPVFAVNPAYTELDGEVCHPTIGDVGADVWLAVVAVPAAQLSTVVDQCIAAHVRGAVIVTAVDGHEVDLPAVVSRARQHGLRLIGPASMGVAASPRAAATAPTLSAALVPVDLPRGKVAISLQSGSLGAGVLQLAARLSMGISWFVSLGDKCDVSGNDLLQFWDDDDDTAVVCLYTESLGNPRKFARIAARVARRRPIVAVRTGSAGSGDARAALYQQAGLIEVPTVLDLLHTARVLACQPVPRGPRVAVLANARSPRVLTVAALETAGLQVVDAPVGLSWRSTADDVASAVTAALAAAHVDAVVVVHAPPVASAPTPAAAIDRAAHGATKPVIAVMLGGADGPLVPGSAVPVFEFPEPAAAVLGRMHAYGHWLVTEAIDRPDAPVDVDPHAVAELVSIALARADRRLDPAESLAILGAYGVATPRTRCTRDGVDHVADLAGTTGFPVALKAERRRLGRSAAAGVALDLVDRDAVLDAARAMRRALGSDAELVTVQAMVPPGVDVRVLVTTDASLGPVVHVGLGGAAADLVADRASRLAPLSVAAATELLDRSRVGAALAALGCSTAPMIDTLCRISHLAADHANLTTIDVNPLLVSATDVWAVDVAIEVSADERDAAPPRRL